MTRRPIFAAVLCILVAAAVLMFLGAAARADVPSIPIARASADPKVDGTLDDPAWKQATHVTLDWDYQFRRPASEKTDAYIMTDSKFIYVALVAEQKEPITATIHSNDVTLGADDVVRVYLWPGGDHGFEYFFVSTPIGTHNEFSSENSAFAPSWTSVGKRTPTGYVVTMRIPLSVMRGDGRSTWRVQFERAIHVTNQDFEWAHDPSQNGVDNSTYVGYLTGMAPARASARTNARIGVYALGQVGSTAAGGDTSHMGADISLPITDSSSFFSTLHPDYSNVDRDQQSISPTAFARQFSEVRPFFTQGANQFQSFNCNDCVDYPFLYTPAIPTPRDGYAVEGTQGLATFSAFDSLGHFNRSDDAETLNWATPNRYYQVHVMHFGTDCPSPDPFPCRDAIPGVPGFHDSTLMYQLVEGNRHNSSVYFTDAQENGTFVTDPSEATMREWGLNLYTQKEGIYPAYHEIGPQFGPVDTFFQTSGIKGPSVFVQREFDFAPTSPILNYSLSQDIQHYTNGGGQVALADAFSSLTLNTKTQFQLNVTSGYQYLLIGSYGSTLDQNGAAISYGPNTSAPTTVTYNVGRFGPGFLRTTTRLTTLRTGPRGTLTLEADNTNQTLDLGGVKEVQWLERASFAYPIDSQSSLAIGARRILGTSPWVTPPPPGLKQPAGFCSPSFVSPGCYSNASNLSLAYYRHVGQDELYLVYGDPNQLNTLPAFIVKFVHYFGAQKGT
jgi:uncharacterized protein DUF5916